MKQRIECISMPNGDMQLSERMKENVVSLKSGYLIPKKISELAEYILSCIYNIFI